MPKLPRVTSVLFGNTGPGTDFGQFGSKVAAAPQTQADYGSVAAFIAGCQALSAWVTGWTLAAVGAAFNPYLEDVNGAFKVFSYFITNAFERGIPDWDAGTTYYQGAEVQDPAGSGQVFASLTDNNLNQALPLGASNAQWQWTNPPELVIGASATVGALPKISGTAPLGGFTGSKATVDSALSDDGVNVKTTLPIKFPDDTIQTTAAINNAVQNQNVVTGARALGTVFQNTGIKPLFVSVSVSCPGGAYAGAYTDAAANPSTVVAEAGSGSGGTAPQVQIFFIVLPGNYYKVAAIAGGPGLSIWTEWS